MNPTGKTRTGTSAALSLICVAGIAAGAAGHPPSYRTVAITGQPAPGTDEGNLDLVVGRLPLVPAHPVGGPRRGRGQHTRCTGRHHGTGGELAKEGSSRLVTHRFVRPPLAW